MKDNVVYVKTEKGIFKCYESETMHKPIYHLVNSNGYIDYTDVIKILTTDDLFIENQKLKKQLNEKIVLEMKLKDELEGKRKEYQEVYKDVRIEIKSYKNQQKEFIEYLEDKLNMCDGFLDTIKSDLEEISYAGRIAGKNYIATQIMKNETSKKNYEEVLSKYKEIIGGE